MLKSPEQFVFKVTEYGDPLAKHFVFFFSPFGVPNWQLSLPGLPIWRLRRAGYRLVVYNYSPAIALRSPQFTIANIDAILRDAHERIDHIRQDASISCFGVSLGTVFATNVTARHDRIKKVVLNLCYSDIADHVLAMPRMRLLPRTLFQEYIDKAGGAAQLRNMFSVYSPVNLVPKLKNKQILLYLSRNDPIHKAIHTIDLVRALDKEHIDYQYYQNDHGRHYLAALYNNLRAKRYLTFLKQ